MKTLNTLLLIGGTGAALVFTSCDKAKIDVDFDVDVADVFMLVDTTSQFGEVDLAATTFQTELAAKLDENDASIDDVESIKLTHLDIKMIDPGTQNFDIVENADGLMSATGLAETKVASIDPVPDGVTQLTLSTRDVNLKQYLAQTVVNFRVTGFTSGPNVERDSLYATMKFKIKAKVKP